MDVCRESFTMPLFIDFNVPGCLVKGKGSELLHAKYLSSAILMLASHTC
jgi:hypothetical protein